MVWAWNKVCGSFINFERGRKILRVLSSAWFIYHHYSAIKLKNSCRRSSTQRLSSWYMPVVLNTKGLNPNKGCEGSKRVAPILSKPSCAFCLPVSFCNVGAFEKSRLLARISYTIFVPHRRYLRGIFAMDLNKVCITSRWNTASRCATNSCGKRYSLFSFSVTNHKRLDTIGCISISPPTTRSLNLRWR